MPSITSGRPRRIDGASQTTRWSQASANSRPPPRQWPLMSATVGICNASRRFITPWARASISNPWRSESMAVNSPTSAPAMNPLVLAEQMSTALGDACSISASAESSSAMTAADSTFCVAPGLSRVSRQMSSAVSMRQFFSFTIIFLPEGLLSRRCRGLLSGRDRSRCAARPPPPRVPAAWRRPGRRRCTRLRWRASTAFVPAR